MQKFFIDENNINEKTVIIDGEDVNHIKNVLRCKVGELIEVCTKSNIPSKYICEIEEMGKDRIICKLNSKLEKNNEPNVKLHIYQGMPKAEKMELIIQKCTELGAVAFTPVEMHRCVVKLNEKDKTKKIERWNKIAEVAAKQSMRDIIPVVNNVINVKELSNEIKNYDLVLLAYEEERQEYLKTYLKNCSNIAVIVGPEGGFEPSEVETLKNAGAKVVTLGNRILRTETAPIALSTIIMYELGDMGNII